MHQLHGTDSFGGILDQLKLARARWEALGYQVRNTRVEHYESVMKRLIELGPVGIMREYTPNEAARTYLIFAEIHEYLFVSRTVCERPHLLAHPRIKEIFSGLPTAAFESNPLPRNTLFELQIAVILDRAGLPSDVTSGADAESEIDDHSLCFECKRPQGFGGLRNCMRDSTKQLRKRLPQLGGNAIGIVALSFGKAVTQGTHRLEVPNEANMHVAMTEVMKRIVVQIMPFWSMYQSHSALFINVCIAGATSVPFVNSQFGLVVRPNLNSTNVAVLEKLQAALGRVTL